jgi:hypothetical protein
MNNSNFLNLLNISLLSKFNIVFKLFFLTADLFTIVFLLVVIKQIFSMDHVVHDSNDSLLIKTFAFSLLFVAVSLFLISLAIL